MTEIINGDGGPSAHLFDPFTRARIAQLALGQPESESAAYVEAEVSLLWPYSSKIGELSLLLADPDVRRRSAKGQLKVTFHGSGAEEVAKSHVGIGDIVRLHIGHARWTNTGDTVSTPGKKVDWDLHLKDRVILDVRRNGTHLATINYEGVPTPPHTPKAPANPRTKSLHTSDFQDDTFIIYTTPTPHRLSSGSFISASLHPFADDDGFIVGKGRKRTKFGRISGSWRLVDEGDYNDNDEKQPVRPEETNATRDRPQPTTVCTNGAPDVVTLDDSSSSEASPVENTMPPPATSFRRAPEKPWEARPISDNVSTPRLLPLASPGLPLVSPLIKSVAASGAYFGSQPSASSELDTISISSTTTQEVLHSNEANLGKTSVDAGSKESEKQAEDAEVPSSEMPLRSASSDVNELPSPTFSDVFGSQSPTFGNTATASPFGSGGISFADFGSLPTAKSAFGAPPTSFGSPTGVMSFGNPFGSSPMAGLGIATGFGFDTPSLSIDENPFAVNKTPLGSQHVIGGSQHKDHSVDDHMDHSSEIPPSIDGDEPITVDKQPLQSPIVQRDLDTFCRERSQSEQAEDDDMYGPAYPVQRIPSVASAASGESGSLHQNWQNNLDITEVDVKIGKLPSPPFPLVQKWGKRGPTARQTSRHSQFLDGATDEISEHGESQSRSEVGNFSERALSHMSFDGDDRNELAHPADVEITEHAIPIGNEAIQNFDSVTSAQVARGPVLELETLPAHTQTKVPNTVQVVGDDRTAEELASTGPEHEEPVDKDSTPKDQDLPSLAMREQLLTPDNTQQNLTEGPSMRSTEQVSSLQMPPTPDNTQEHASATMLQFINTDDLQPVGQKQSGKELVPQEADTTERFLSRPIRKASNVQTVSSPYFASRRSSRLSPERQTISIDQTKPQEDEDARPASPELDQPVSGDLEVLATGRDRRLQPSLGLVTPLSYYTPLRNLSEHFGQPVDVLALCISNSGEPTRSKAGPMDYNSTLHLADSFLVGMTTITAQVFRPYKRALPVVKRGQVVLLRAFKVQSRKRKMMLLSTDSSAWAVFSVSSAPANDVESRGLRVKTPGPPVEYGSEEQVYARKLMQWWNSEGMAAHPDSPNRVKGISLETRSNKTRETKSRRTPVDPLQTTCSTRPTDNQPDKTQKSAASSPVFEPTSPQPLPRPSRQMDLTDNAGNSEDADTADKTEPLPEIPSPKVGRRPRRSTSVISATLESSRSLRSQVTVHKLRDGTKYVDGKVPSKDEVVHELRDGTKYVDETLSPTGKAIKLRQENLIHELRDGTNYVDRLPSKSSDVRKSVRTKDA